jgi:hypothetical protein
MSVMVISGAELGRFAIFAKRHRLLPPSVSAVDFAQRLRDANLACLPVTGRNTAADVPPLDRGLIEAASLVEVEQETDLIGLMRTGVRLGYNLQLFRGQLPLAVITRVIARAAVLRQTLPRT